MFFIVLLCGLAAQGAFSKPSNVELSINNSDNVSINSGSYGSSRTGANNGISTNQRSSQSQYQSGVSQPSAAYQSYQPSAVAYQSYQPAAVAFESYQPAAVAFESYQPAAVAFESYQPSSLAFQSYQPSVAIVEQPSYSVLQSTPSVSIVSNQGLLQQSALQASAAQAGLQQAALQQAAFQQAGLQQAAFQTGLQSNILVQGPQSASISVLPSAPTTVQLTSNNLNEGVVLSSNTGGGYGGFGSGEVSVLGELPLIGNTQVLGSLPVEGIVGFAGQIPAGGIINIYGSVPCIC